MVQLYHRIWVEPQILRIRTNEAACIHWRWEHGRVFILERVEESAMNPGFALRILKRYTTVKASLAKAFS
jgi:hypothetical protein